MRLMTGSWLVSVRRDALRRRIWFRVLTRLQRSVVELTIRCVDRIQSSKLALVISRIVCKLLKAGRSRFLKQVEIVGSKQAEQISRVAVGWGYVEASSWRRDPVFIRYCGVNAMNSPSGWRHAVSS